MYWYAKSVHLYRPLKTVYHRYRSAISSSLNTSRPGDVSLRGVGREFPLCVDLLGSCFFT